MKYFVKIPLLVISVLAFFLSGCGANKAEEQKKQHESLAKEVMALHDEVMPRMGELVGLRKQIKSKINLWTETETSDFDSLINEARLKIENLDAADKAMMDWMHNYNGGQGLYEHELIMEYLNGEKVKMQKVKKDMNSSIENAQTFLSSNP